MRALWATVLALFALAPTDGNAQEAWLVTYGPGEEVWERFGHNALWLVDEESGLDHTFSFGYFELDRAGFYFDFARGIMRYYGSSATSTREFEFYRGRDRSITAQRLDLTPSQVRWLHRLLDDAIFPVPQYYDYDYYFANCSTWLRDLIDKVTAGSLAEFMHKQPARQNFREHTSRLNMQRPWLHAGLMTLLGPEIDRERTAWEEAFLPEALAYWIEQLAPGGQSLVTETRVIHDPQVHQPPESDTILWWFYLLLGLLGVVLVTLPLWRSTSAWTLLPWRIAVTGYGLAGGLIVLMWLATAHYPVAGNLVLFFLHPLWLLFLLPVGRNVKMTVWWLLAAATAAGAVLLALPDGPQYRADLLLWLVPMTVAMLWTGRRTGQITREARDAAG
ncbi:DUF4105 domain-containing protein [Wenzhouxiangella sp. AB-CW3]|uniref:lipoprotein N-acyltransferase Lnb domain-containing protein n=1 Tax=Wenzhouxiangella sp. AB-CW3 TaxID=2771012 RepID=UPI00168BFD2A|nr:DUF4105 domain-containing protein [Wenzhouxiangella sp. AB-CW3]QOC23877.1 DUF4105 domain-containing protein [Wenzhouxiangella sp. AB-CW3]